MLDHPNILRYYEMYEDQRFLHVVMELCTGGSLTDRLVSKGVLRESEARAIFTKLVSAVNHIHSIGLCHRDLRPENILYLNTERNADFKIVDFCDLTFITMADKNSSLARCPNFMAPELFDGTFGIECDIWSLGGILYYLLSGELPFDDSDQPAQLYHIMAGDYTFSTPIWNSISKAAKDLIKKMMVVKPRLRLTLNEVMQHQWVTARHEDVAVSVDVLNSIITYKPPKRLQREVLRAVVKYASPNDLSELTVKFMLEGVFSLRYGEVRCTENRSIKTGVSVCWLFPA